MTSRRQSIEQWAMEMNFTAPLDWGEIEREVLRRKHPPLPDEPVSARISDLAIDGAFHLLLAVIIGLPLWALAAVLVGVCVDADRGEAWISMARLPLVATIGVPATLLMNARRGERLAAWEALVILADAALAFGCYAILSREDGVSSVNATGWLALIVTVISLSCLGWIAMVGGRARGDRSRSERTSAGARTVKVPGSFYLRQRCLAARERVLGILVERGLVDMQQAKKAQMLAMPLGSWSTLTS